MRKFINKFGSQPVKQVELPQKKIFIKPLSRYGFDEAVCVSCDEVQELVAIGTKDGITHIFGKDDIHVTLKSIDVSSVKAIHFKKNEGAVIIIYENHSIILWSIRQVQPMVVASLKFTREKITSSLLPFGSDWLYVGTAKGSLHTIQISDLKLSDYSVRWNQFFSSTENLPTHPGLICRLLSYPIDANKILVAFESGSVIIFRLTEKEPCASFFRPSTSSLIKVTDVAFSPRDAKKILISYNDGALCYFLVPDGVTDVKEAHRKSMKMLDGKVVSIIDTAFLRIEPQPWLMIGSSNLKAFYPNDNLLLEKLNKMEKLPSEWTSKSEII